MKKNVKILIEQAAKSILQDAITNMKHALLFVDSKQRMHPDGSRQFLQSTEALENLQKQTDAFVVSYEKPILDWKDVNETVPESYRDLRVKLPGITDDNLCVHKTEKVLVLTDCGTITDNFRIKMRKGEKEWVWFCNYDGEKVVKWCKFNSPE